MSQYDMEQIARRAYEIWDREGRPEGRELDHWRQAERELGVASSESGRDERAISDHVAASSTQPEDAGSSDAGSVAGSEIKKPRAPRSTSTER